MIQIKIYKFKFNNYFSCSYKNLDKIEEIIKL